jgi:hypothetical protein
MPPAQGAKLPRPRVLCYPVAFVCPRLCLASLSGLAGCPVERLAMAGPVSLCVTRCRDAAPVRAVMVTAPDGAVEKLQLETVASWSVACPRRDAGA